MSVKPANLELREVSGPSALGGGRHRFFELLWLMSVTEFKRTFFGTVLGYVWSLMRPLLLFAVLLLVFTKIFRIGSQVPHYPVLLLFNIVLFGFFQEGTGGAVASVVGQEGIVRKTQFPRLVIPLAVVLTALFTLGLNMIVVFAFMLGFGVTPMWTWLLFPLILLPLGVFTAALAMLLSALNVRFRDVAIIWVVVATALNYGTPIIYPMKIVPGGLKQVILANPLTPIFQQARVWMIDPHAYSPLTIANGPVPLIAAALIYIGVCVAGVWVFNREAPRIAEQL
ncbi:MAG TPA: ABC transporter permease [Solirubrobacterales bacterium]|nr:ABC transporter permease [Solirubrobacterales bacterium]